MTSTPQAATDAPALLRGLFDDAIDMAVRGFASAADSDTAMRLGAGHPAGPFELRALHVDPHRGPPHTPSPEQRARATSGNELETPPITGVPTQIGVRPWQIFWLDRSTA
jgi:3-hydroxybutyryl-CoA dehydrogenase